MKDVKLVLCDLDGTLLDDNKNVDLDIKNIALKKNLLLTLVSGRNLGQVLTYVDALDIRIPFITNNGASVCLGKERLYGLFIDRHCVEDILMFLTNYNISFLVNCDSGVYSYGQDSLIQQFKLRSIGKCPVFNTVPISRLVEENIEKIIMSHPDDELMTKISNILNERFPRTYCVRSEGRAFTLTNKNASKGSSVKWLLDHLGIEKEHAIAFGDNFNDISMFKSVKYSVAMDNAAYEVKRNATYITKSNNERGVSYFIEHYVK